MTAPRWQAIGASVRGDSHRRSGAPNQDSLALVPGHGDSAMVAVADGHGGAISFRSDFGSSVATTIAIQVVRAFSPTVRELDDPQELLRVAAEQIPVSIVQGWTSRVGEDLGVRPFDERELALVREMSQGDPVADLQENPLIAYGATMLIVAAIGRFLLCLQLGDGDIVCLAGGDPPIASRPVPSDPRLIGNQTTSLCLPTAVQDFRVAVIAQDDPQFPSLVAVTTDGYVNSFVDDTAFLQAAPDILDHAMEHGLSSVGEQLPGWLEKASRLGSGDDITMAIMTRSDVIDGGGSTSTSAETAEPGRESAARMDGGRPTRAVGSPPPHRTGPTVAVTAAIALGAAVLGGIVGSALGGSGSEPSLSAAVSTPADPTSAPDDLSVWVWIGDGRFARADGRGVPVRIAEMRGVKAADIMSAFGGIWLLSTDGRVFVVDPDRPAATDVVTLRGSNAGPTQLRESGASMDVFTDDPGVHFEIDPQSLAVEVVGEDHANTITTDPVTNSDGPSASASASES